MSPDILRPHAALTRRSQQNLNVAIVESRSFSENDQNLLLFACELCCLVDFEIHPPELLALISSLRFHCIVHLLEEMSA